MPTDWDERYRTGDMPWEKGAAHPALIEFLKSNPVRGRVLVPGCGLGHDVRALAATADEVVGFDIAPAAVKRAKAHPSVGGERYVLGDLFNLPPALRGSFDLVFEHTCFCAIDPSRRADYVAAVNSALRPDGQLLAVFYLDPGLDPGETGPPFGVTLAELDTLFGPRFAAVKEWSPTATYPGREGRDVPPLEAKGLARLIVAIFPFLPRPIHVTVPPAMKTLLRFVPLLLIACIARADIIIEQKMESAVINGSVTMKVKGDQARMDMPNPLGGNVTTLMNFKSGDMVTLMHQQKMAMKMNLSDVKKQQEAGQKALGMDPSKMEKPKATGTMEKVGDYNTELYEMKQGGMEAKIWVAKDFPNAQAIKEQMMKLSSSIGGAGFDPSKLDVPGMVVKSEVNTPVGKMTVTLVRAEEKPVDDAEFKQPEGYQEMKMPTMPAPGAPPPPAPAAPAPPK